MRIARRPLGAIALLSLLPGTVRAQRRTVRCAGCAPRPFQYSGIAAASESGSLMCGAWGEEGKAIVPAPVLGAEEGVGCGMDMS